MTRAEKVRAEAQRLLSAPNAPRLLTEMVVAQSLVIEELTKRVATLEAVLATTGSDTDPKRRGKRGLIQ